MCDEWPLFSQPWSERVTCPLRFQPLHASMRLGPSASTSQHTAPARCVAQPGVRPRQFAARTHEAAPVLCTSAEKEGKGVKGGRPSCLRHGGTLQEFMCAGGLTSEFDERVRLIPEQTHLPWGAPGRAGCSPQLSGHSAGRWAQGENSARHTGQVPTPLSLSCSDMNKALPSPPLPSSPGALGPPLQKWTQCNHQTVALLWDWNEIREEEVGARGHYWAPGSPSR